MLCYEHGARGGQRGRLLRLRADHAQLLAGMAMQEAPCDLRSSQPFCRLLLSSVAL